MTFDVVRTPDGVDVDVTGEWSDEARAVIESGVADGVDLNYARGFRERDLEFLRGLPIRRVRILARTHADIEPLYSLAGTLEALDIQIDPRTQIDVDRLPGLRRLSASWQQIARTIQHAEALVDLAVESYAETDLTPLIPLGSLTKLWMKQHPQLRSLDGVEDLPWLSHLGVFLARRLEDISALDRAKSPVLTRLELESCKELPDLDSVGGLMSLTHLNLGDDGDFPTVAPLGGLENLEQLLLSESTRIIDGDLTPIVALPRLRELRLMNRRNYAPTAGAVVALVAQRAERARPPRPELDEAAFLDELWKSLAGIDFIDEASRETQQLTVHTPQRTSTQGFPQRSFSVELLDERVLPTLPELVASGRERDPASGEGDAGVAISEIVARLEDGVLSARGGSTRLRFLWGRFAE